MYVPHLRRTIIYDLRAERKREEDTRQIDRSSQSRTVAKKDTRRWRTSRFLADARRRRRSYRGTAVHYFLMSNKAISMCPDQGPQLLTRVISPGSPACATSSSEADPPLALLLSPPLPAAPCAGRWRGHVTTLHPQRRGTPDAAEERERDTRRDEDGGDSVARARARSQGRRGIEEGGLEEGEATGGPERRPCPPSGGASKGNFTKADPLVMNVI